MSLKITIHKGSGEIGGTCIELLADNTKIVLDAGSPLSENSKPAKLNKINPDAILISHPHMDHYGLLGSYKNDKTKIYIGGIGHKLINIARTFCGKQELKGNIHPIKRNTSFRIGPFKVTPYLMDHSAVDAYSFFIKTKYGNVFYSGDFRAHGKKKELLSLIEKDAPKNVDIMFLEGTMFGRVTEDVSSEESLEEKIIDVIKDQKNASFLFSSSQNIDRMTVAYQACLKTGKTFVVDIYTALILEEVSRISKATPRLDMDSIRVLFFSTHCKHLFSGSCKGGVINKLISKRIKPEEIKKEASKYLVQLSSGLGKVVYGFKSKDKPNMIYSQWLGYLEKEEYKKRYKQIRDLIASKVVNFNYIHTSGHAKIEDLKRLVDAINPKHVVPIHTENPDEYLKITKKVLKIENEKQITLNGGKIYD